MRRLFRKRQSKQDSDSSAVLATGAPPSSTAVATSPSLRTQTHDKFALLALSPLHKAFEIKEFAWKEQSQQVEYFLTRLSAILKPRLAEQTYCRLVDAAGNVFAPTDALEASRHAQTLLVAVPETETSRTCHAWAREILTETQVSTMLRSKGYRIDDWHNIHEVFTDEPRGNEGEEEEEEEENQTTRSCWSICCCLNSKKRIDNSANEKTKDETAPLLQSTSRENKVTENSQSHERSDKAAVSSSTIVVLLLNIATRRFELVALQRTATCTTVDHVLKVLPTAVQDKSLRKLKLMSLADRSGNEWCRSSPLPNVPAWFVVAITPKLSPRQAQGQARKLLQDKHVQATLRSNGVELTQW